MKIVLSGGWGYGNLGDDAILLETLKNIYLIYPNAEICILSANIHETYFNIKEQFPNVNVHDSFHTMLFGNVHKSMYKPVHNRISDDLIFRIYSKFWNIQEKRLSKYVFTHTDEILDYLDRMHVFKNKDIFQGCNMYIMSGGGYLNSWYSMGVAKYIETLYAKKYNIPIMLVGQTVGPFKDQFSKKYVSQILKLSSKTVFRDNDSYTDFSSEIDSFSMAKAMPDIALSDGYHFERKNQIVFIPFKLDILENIDIISKNLEKLSKMEGMQIILTVSQLWNTPIMLIYRLYNLLKSRNLDVIIQVPQNTAELQKILGESKCVISQNLHGLILAYRASTSIICLNKQRKFVSFMEQVESSDCIVLPNEILSDDCFVKLYKIAQRKKKDIGPFKREIHQIFKDLLK